MPDMAARTVRVEDLDSRTPSPVRRLDLYAVLAAAALACVVYVAALLTGVALAPGVAVAAIAAAPVCATFALALLWQRSRGESDDGLAWFTAGLTVAVATMALHLVALPEVSPSGGPLRTGTQSWATLFLLFHLAPALGAAAGALGAPPRWRWPATGAGVLTALLVAGDRLPLPVLIRPDGTFTPARLVSEWAVVAAMAVCAAVWVLRVGRTPQAVRGWIAVALSLATYDLVLNALAGARFTPLWWGSVSLRVATYAVLAFGLLRAALNQLRDLETYASAELGRREGQLSSALTRTRQLLRCSEDLALAVTPEEVATALAADIAAMTGLPRVAVVAELDGRLIALGTAGYGGDLAAWAHRVDWAAPLPAPRALLSGESVFLPTAPDVQERFPGLAGTPLSSAQALAALPLVVRGEPIAVVVVWDVAPVDWTPAVRELLAGLAAQGGQALARARAFEETTAAATALQTSLLPSVLPQRAGLALAVRYTPGHPAPGHRSGGGVGGDWYDCVEVDDHRVALVVGDVMGKGLHAAAVMGQMRTTVRALTAIDPSPRVVLAALDRVTRDLSDDVITTVAYVLLDTDTGSAQVGRAGHLPPLLVGPDGTVRTLEAGGSPPLGAPVREWAQSEVDVPAGSLLVLYSDGLVESRRTGLEPGLGDLSDAVSGLASAGTDVERMAGAVMDRLAGAERDDDITLLLVRLVGASLPAQGSPASAG